MVRRGFSTGGGLEGEFQAELNLAGAGGCGGDDSCRRAGDDEGSLVGGAALAGPGGEDDRVGRGEVGVVEDVEEFSAELGAEALADLGGFVQREVEIGETGADQGVAAQIAVGSVGGRTEGCCVEVLSGRAGIELAVEVGVEVGTDRIAGVAVAGGVVAELRREGEAGLDGRDPAEGPAADGAVDYGVEVGSQAMAAAEG